MKPDATPEVAHALFKTGQSPQKAEAVRTDVAGVPYPFRSQLYVS